MARLPDQITRGACRRFLTQIQTTSSGSKASKSNHISSELDMCVVTTTD